MYIASWSGGKDSTASIILAHIHGEPLDEIIFSEVMYDESISGELPEHIAYIHSCIPIFESWGYKVTILHAKKTYTDCFFHRVSNRSKNKDRVGKLAGFPMAQRCVINRDCKIKPIRDYLKEHSDAVQYIGIAADEPHRFKVLSDNKVSLLAKYGYTESMAYDLCKEYGLLSPVYAFSERGGCWFCPNARHNELRHLYDNHRELFDKLTELERTPEIVGDVWNTLHRHSIQDIEKSFKFDDSQVSFWELAQSRQGA